MKPSPFIVDCPFVLSVWKDSERHTQEAVNRILGETDPPFAAAKAAVELDEYLRTGGSPPSNLARYLLPILRKHQKRVAAEETAQADQRSRREKAEKVKVERAQPDPLAEKFEALPEDRQQELLDAALERLSEPLRVPARKKGARHFLVWPHIRRMLQDETEAA